MSTFMVFFMDAHWYSKFLGDKLEDLNVSVGDWEAPSGTPRQGTADLTRKISSFHPSKISFPGLPSHAESMKTQSLSIRRTGNQSSSSNSNSGSGSGSGSSVSSSIPDENLGVSVHISEVNSFRDIPYADYFNVQVCICICVLLSLPMDVSLTLALTNPSTRYNGKSGAHGGVAVTLMKTRQLMNHT